MAELNWSMDPNPLDNWICSNNTDINKQQKKHAQIHFHSKRPHTTTKLNDNINIDIHIYKVVFLLM
jgi:hypothetical protein